MSQFLTSLKAERVGDNWVLLAQLRYQSDVAKGIIVVPKGFSSDFASVPRLPFTYMLAGDTAHAPSVVHDFAYRTCLQTRRIADNVFWEAMTVTGEPRWRKILMWTAVRSFGWTTWNRNCHAKR